MNVDYTMPVIYRQPTSNCIVAYMSNACAHEAMTSHCTGICQKPFHKNSESGWELHWQGASVRNATLRYISYSVLSKIMLLT